MSDFDSDRESMINRARDAGVELLVCVGNGEIQRDSHSAAIKLAEKYDFIYTTVGVHPHEARLYSSDIEARLKTLASHPRVIGWGEVGLDYHYNNSPRDTQRDVFRRQVRLARERRLPAIIHTREAEPDTLTILDEEWSSELPGVIHCFTGTRHFAERVVEMGFYISFSGVVTFKKSEDLRQTAKMLPADRILIETDAPFLAPMPYRGRRNEPAYVVETARCIAEVRGIELADVATLTSDNFKRAFFAAWGLSGT